MTISKAARWADASLYCGVGLIAAVILVESSQPALAQAPVVYKASAPASGKSVPAGNVMAHGRAADGLSLNVAPHAPIPTFGGLSAAPEAPTELRPEPVAGFGPIPPAASGSREKVTPLRSLAAPYAGPPYQVEGRWYVPAHEPNYDEVGTASWYGPGFHGKASATGEVFDESALTAAHPTLPIPSLVRVTNLQNNKTVVVRLNDRGPFVDDRIIDLSRAAAASLDMQGQGTARVRVQYVGPAPAAPGDPVASPAQGLGLVARPLPPVPPAPVLPAPVQKPLAADVVSGGFYLQAGSFADLTNANAAKAKLQAHGAATIRAVTVNGTVFYRVLLGPWSSRSDADRARERLVQAGTNAIVVADNR